LSTARQEEDMLDYELNSEKNNLNEDKGASK
jgi:hypothetical protein